tara:strand:- start:1687 stop:2076 length:390 start_codon:yes stop_codon:yes gene_type:complete
MSNRKYAIDGACLRCTLGTTEGKLKVTSQQKLFVQGKLKVTSEDKQVPTTFGSCNRSSPPPACVPDLQQWQNTSKKSKMGNKTFVMEDSTIQCSQGGLVTIQDHTQIASAGGSGAQQTNMEETTPMMNG